MSRPGYDIEMRIAARRVASRRVASRRLENRISDNDVFLGHVVTGIAAWPRPTPPSVRTTAMAIYTRFYPSLPIRCQRRLERA